MLARMAQSNPFVVHGGSGLRRSHRRVTEERGRNLDRGWISGLRTYAEMEDNSAVVGAIMLSIRSICGQVPWHAKPADLPDGVTPTQLAAYTVVTRVLLNLDETITKE